MIILYDLRLGNWVYHNHSYVSRLIKAHTYYL